MSVTGYRLIQEALTNVRRHAGSVEHVAVTLRISDDAISIDIVDDGRGIGSLPGADGFGIVGMRERVGAIQWRRDCRSSCGWRLAIAANLPVDAGAGHRLSAGSLP